MTIEKDLQKYKVLCVLQTWELRDTRLQALEKGTEEQA